MTRLQQNAIATVGIALMMTLLTEAAYVDLYRDADFENKIMRVDDVIVDVCYNFDCKWLDNTITSAKWHGLPETGSYFEGGYSIIFFYTGHDCSGKGEQWAIDTQSDDDKYFPENFRLDGINDDISSFIALNKGPNGGTLNVCSIPEDGVATNATFNGWGKIAGPRSTALLDVGKHPLS